MKKILLVFLLLGLLGGWTEKPKKTEVSSMDLTAAETYLNNGKDKYDLIDFKGAISDFDKAILLEPQFTFAYNYRGLAKYQLQDYKGAILDYDKSIELNPNDFFPYYNRAFAKYKLKDLEGSSSDFDKAYKLYSELENTIQN